MSASSSQSRPDAAVPRSAASDGANRAEAQDAPTLQARSNFTRREEREPIRSEALFGGASEVRIAHRGALYCLRVTALGKLILTK
ncbi:MAG: hemin uptake protein HemP [Caldimonas sp.]